jgi:hypothetical protein
MHTDRAAKRDAIEALRGAAATGSKANQSRDT